MIFFRMDFFMEEGELVDLLRGLALVAGLAFVWRGCPPCGEGYPCMAGVVPVCGGDCPRRPGLSLCTEGAGPRWQGLSLCGEG
jgi:hypothetical protein